MVICSNPKVTYSDPTLFTSPYPQQIPHLSGLSSHYLRLLVVVVVMEGANKIYCQL